MSSNIKPRLVEAAGRAIERAKQLPWFSCGPDNIIPEEGAKTEDVLAAYAVAYVLIGKESDESKDAALNLGGVLDVIPEHFSPLANIISGIYEFAFHQALSAALRWEQAPAPKKTLEGAILAVRIDWDSQS